MRIATTRIKRFYIPKNQKISDKSFSQLILASVLGILLCTVCLGGLTWAWFSDSVTSNTDTLRSATYDIQAEVKKESDGSVVAINEDNTYTLDAGETYTVKLKATGNASTGYCKVTLNDKDYYTTQIVPGNYVTFTIVCPESIAAKVSFSSQWMTYAGYSETATNLIGQEITTITAEAVVSKNSINALTQATPDPAVTDPDPSASEIVYVVKQGDTLYEIAGAYGTTVPKLVAYNSIADANRIQIGDIIKIPPAGYEIPSAN